jgi:hypothetical protein
MPACQRCRTPLDDRFRYCPWCGGAQRRKLVEFFRPHPRDEGRALRVSRYLDEHERQVRVSVWSAEGVAEAAISLDDEEAHRLARFLAEGERPPAPSMRHWLRRH